MEENAELIGILIVYSAPLFLLVATFFVGRILEKAHFKSIREREAVTEHLPAVPTVSLDSDETIADSRLVTASVVVSLDYFKKFLASFRNIFGGNVQSYQSLLDRAKREAVLRLKEQVPDSHIIVNLRIITSNISSVQTRKKGIGGVEVLAFGTAIRYQQRA